MLQHYHHHPHRHSPRLTTVWEEDTTTTTTTTTTPTSFHREEGSSSLGLERRSNSHENVLPFFDLEDSFDDDHEKVEQTQRNSRMSNNKKKLNSLSLRMGGLCGGLFQIVHVTSSLSLSEMLSSTTDATSDVWNTSYTSTEPLLLQRIIIPSGQFLERNILLSRVLHFFTDAEIGLLFVLLIAFGIQLLPLSLILKTKNTKQEQQQQSSSSSLNGNMTSRFCAGWMIGSCFCTLTICLLVEIPTATRIVITTALKLVVCSMILQWSEWNSRRRRTMEVFHTAMVYTTAIYLRLWD